ncbi:hypothetical protein BV20DRAFT_964878 [Pilatotrama ljubarskyi]|nr:hypothetical protein BV20DRAFT_964878 [Pilatotrama ljubarskyi]
MNVMSAPELGVQVPMGSPSPTEPGGSAGSSQEGDILKRNSLQLLSLNQDVLSHIISYLSYPDALSLAHTCKAAHALSLDPALHTVVLDRFAEQLTKFRDFLLAKPSRPLFLKSLIITKTVTWDMEAGKAAEALGDVLEKATMLEHFSCGEMRNLVAADARVKDNLIALTRLTGLTLLEGGPETAEIAASLKSEGIRQLTLDMLWHSRKTTFEYFFGSFRRYRRLELLSISRMYAKIIIPLVASDITIVMPSVRTLELHRSYIPLSLAATVFPSVTNLTFTNARHYPNFGYRDVLPAEVAHCWANVDEAHIDARDLVFWPISCRVRWLDLDVLRGGYSREAIAAVDRTCPRVLSCAYTIDADNLFWVRLPVIATELRLLDVRLLELSGNPKKYMLTHLTRFPALTVIFLCIRAFYQPSDQDAETASIAQDLAERNRHLRFIGVSFADGRSTPEDAPVWDEERLSSTWFKVLRDEHDVRRTERIPTATGLRVRDYMYQANYDAPGWEEVLSTLG